MEQPLHGPVLVSCDFLLFGEEKEHLRGRNLEEEEELGSIPSELMSEIPSDMILRIFDHWRRRRCFMMELEYIE
jgi:hypothetical protein